MLPNLTKFKSYVKIQGNPSKYESILNTITRFWEYRDRNQEINLNIDGNASRKSHNKSCDHR